VVVVYFGATTTGFFSIINAKDIARDISLIGIVAVGEAMLVLTGQIDLSVGATLGCTGVVLGQLLVYGHMPFWPAAVVAILAGGVLGLFNGLVVTILKINPIIATLATWTAYGGLAFILSNGTPIYGFPPDAATLGNGELLSVPYPVWAMLGAFALGWVLLYRTRVGRQIYAIGGNREAARLSGVRVGSVIVALFVVTGLLAGFAGVFTASRLLSSAPAAGTGFELSVITAVFVGGISYVGGEGRLGGVLVGVVVLGVLQNGMTLNAVQPFVQQVVFGAFLLAAVAFDQGLARVSRHETYQPRDKAEAPPPWMPASGEMEIDPVLTTQSSERSDR